MEDESFKDQEQFILQARNYLDRGLYQNARDLAEKRLDLIPGDLETHIILCEALWGMGRDEEAQEILKEIEEIIQGYSEIYVRMGKICQKQGLRAEAALYYQRFIVLNPRSPMRTDIDHQLAFLLDKLGNPTSSDEERTSGNPAVEQLPSVLPKLRKWLDNLNRLKR
jgi:tetratricopeptide (TPR) repeat protein